MRPLTVAVLSPVTGGVYFGGVMSGVSREVRAAGGRVLLVQTLDAGLSSDEELAAPDFGTPVGWDHVDGVVALPSSVQRSYLERLRAAGKPVVLAGNHVDGFAAPFVVPDNEGGVRGLVQHLVEVHGHTRIGFLGNLEQSDMRERHRAYERTLRSYGIAPDPALFYEASGNHEAGGRAVAARLIAEGMPVPAIVAATDRNALGLTEALRSAGWSVPEELAVVGFDDIEPLTMATPGLTTVDQQFHEVGALAAQVLLASIAGAPAVQERHVSTARLVVRSSCGCSTRERPQQSGSAALLRTLCEAMASQNTAPASSEVVRAVAIELGVALDRALQRDVRLGSPLVAAMARLHRLELTAEALHRVVTALVDHVSGATGIAAEHRADVTLSLTRAAADLWVSHSASLLTRGTQLERGATEQYEVSMSLLDTDGATARSLDWLSCTPVTLGCLALWEGDPEEGVLRVSGVFDPGGVVPGGGSLVGTRLPVEQFPPASLLAQAADGNGEGTFVIPVRARGADWGLLAVSGWIDARSMDARASYNHWAALLTVAFEQERLLQDVRTSEERYAVAAQATDDGLWDWDLRSDDTYYSDRCRRMLAADEDATGPDVLFDAAHPDDVEALRSALTVGDTVATRTADIELRVRGVDGSYRWVLCRARLVGIEGQPPHRIVGSLSDVHNRREIEEQLRRQAMHDPVTGLPNRIALVERLTSDLRTQDDTLAVLFLDLDGFKEVNDRLGHAAGDRLLVVIAERLAQQTRPADLPARFGGDEFAVLLHLSDAASLDVVVRRVQEAIALPVQLGAEVVSVTASAGAALAGPTTASAEELIDQADQAMYKAKWARRGTYVLHRPPTSP